jgi:hypothetical protein
MSIVDAIYTYLPAKRKHTPSGWTKFNAVCCHHNGTSADTRARAGIIRNAEGCSYHCFNCGYKASYTTGRLLTRKLRQLLSWLGAPDDVINKLALEAMKVESDQRVIEAVTVPQFENKPLPEAAMPIAQWLEQYDDMTSEFLNPVVDYVVSRGFDPMNHNFYWSPSAGYADRVIIPFRHQGRIVGNTARKITDGRPKYLSDQTPGYVFNLDSQPQQRKFVIVVEGPMDALSLDAVAILGAEIMPKQALQINQLHKEVIVLPDRDRDGERTVAQAIELGWSVSLPDFGTAKDANDAVNTYGVLWTLQQIIQQRNASALKIKLASKAWFTRI